MKTNIFIILYFGHALLKGTRVTTAGYRPTRHVLNRLHRL